jgi:putative transposase
LIFDRLRAGGFDAFLDVSTIDNGAFDTVILSQIGARPHFVVLISPGSMERCQNIGDWLRREIEEAMTLGRNVVPLIEEGVDFNKETNYLPEHLRVDFRRYNGIPLSERGDHRQSIGGNHRKGGIGGDDAAKKVKGRKRIWADGSYRGDFSEWVKRLCGWTGEVALRSDDAQGFHVIPKRWIVERTFAWLLNFRRLNKDYEYHPCNTIAMIYAAMVRLMVRRLAHD